MIQKVLTFILLLYSSTFILHAQSCGAALNSHGENEWLVNVYTGIDANNIPNTNFRGFYRQKIDQSGDFGVNTALSWAVEDNTKPSDARAFNTSDVGYGTNYSGCTLTNQSFTFVHKRRGFPPGQYQIYLDLWDDYTEIYLNGVSIKQTTRYGTNSYAFRCIFLDGNSLVEIRTDNRGLSRSGLKATIKLSTINFGLTNITNNLCPNTNSQLTFTASHTGQNVGSTAITTTSLNDSLTNILWTGGPYTGSNTNRLLNATPYTTTTYTVTAQYQQCTFSANTTITVNPATPPTEFGPNTWYVYGNSTVNNVPDVYYGYYTQNIDTETNYGFNTTTTESGGWPNNRNPSRSNSWNGCQITNHDYFTYTHKRKGFPCGNYQLVIKNWDRNTYIKLNGVEIATNANACQGTTCANFIPNQIYALDANSTIEVFTRHLTGDTKAILEIKPVNTTTLANNNDQRTCPVKGNQWVNFYQYPSGRYIGSVKGETAATDLGNVTMTAYVDVQNQVAEACNLPSYITAVMQRHWVITPDNNLPGVVRLPYSNAEFLALRDKSLANANPDDDVIYPLQQTIKMSKYAGPANINNLVNDNCSGSTTLHTSINNVAPGAYYYQDFNIPGFSEFWLHGMTHTSPLGSFFSNIDIDCNASNTNLIVKYESTSQPITLEVENSNDGFVWNYINTYTIQDETSQLIIRDQASNASYYRLKAINHLGKVIETQIIESICKTGNPVLRMHPNPAKETLNLDLTINPEVNSELQIEITDAIGKMVLNQELLINTMQTRVVLDVSMLQSGTYYLHLKANGKTLNKMEKLIIF